MKKAVLYARVSSDQQKKEGTIESQILELKKQVVDSGDVLVKEYIDDGYSGARLDRPGMDLLRNDLKTNLFDTIYVLNTDRIAREVTYQTIIIAEILKNKKQVIINGKDYIHNPENKFTLTVLGAVAELERTKIVERATRGKQMKIAQGQLIGCGSRIFGYDFHVKTPTSAPYYTINEAQSKIVKFVFDSYINKEIGISRISKILEEQGALTKSGKTIWRVSLLKAMVKNEMYTGIRYFNMMKRIREYANPIHGIKFTTSKNVPRDRSEWIGIKVPVIIERELFDKVQAKLEYNKKKYRNPKVVQLLSCMVTCGYCKHSMFVTRKYYKDRRKVVPTLHYIAAYRCNYRDRMRAHIKNVPLIRCIAPQIKAEVLENKVLEMIDKILTDETKIRDHIEFFDKKVKTNQLKIEEKLKHIDEKIEKINLHKRHILDLYAVQELDKETYMSKNTEFDININRLKLEKSELLKKIPLLHKTEIVDISIKDFCNKAKARFEQSVDIETKRKFFSEFIESIIYNKQKVQITGSIPVKLKSYSNDETTELAKLEFCIKDTIPKDKLRSIQGERIALDKIKLIEYSTELEKTTV